MKSLTKFFAISALTLSSLLSAANIPQIHADGFAISLEMGNSWHRTPTIANGGFEDQLRPNYSDYNQTDPDSYSLYLDDLARFEAGNHFLNAHTSSRMWGGNLGHYWSVEGTPFQLGLLLGYYDNGEARITFYSGNQYVIRSAQVNLMLDTRISLCKEYYLTAKAGAALVHQSMHLDAFDYEDAYLKNTSKDKILPVLALGAGRNMGDGYSLFTQVRYTMGSKCDNFDKFYAYHDEDGNGNLKKVTQNVTWSVGVEKMF